MKKLLTVAAISLLALTGCTAASNSDSTAKESTETTATTEAATPVDLAGEWKQTNSNSPENYQTATISGETISVDWVNETDSSKSVYWAGTFIAPTEPADSYKWDSVNDTTITDTALLASGDDTKTFTYEGGVLSYDVTAMGTTQTVKLERQ
ncbi:hypothetical protein [Leucobacter japonicus]|uniref:hypothetical protein n=1 Tax=Leucobacter japonicus TaxID=1461259 RepID=UPI0006A75CD3|nr:hypothetical protein [Leucobacter japonicus]